MTTYDEYLTKIYNELSPDSSITPDEYIIAPKQSKQTFFSIKAPERNFLKWAAELCESYGFDYSIEKSLSAGRIIAWPSKDSDEQILTECLEEDYIEFTKFQVSNLNRFFGR